MTTKDSLYNPSHHGLPHPGLQAENLKDSVIASKYPNLENKAISNQICNLVIA